MRSSTAADRQTIYSGKETLRGIRIQQGRRGDCNRATNAVSIAEDEGDALRKSRIVFVIRFNPYVMETADNDLQVIAL
eukprot:IDg4059t1